MGFLSNFLCCRRQKKIEPTCKVCMLKLPIENVHMRRRRYTIPKRPKENVFHLLKYMKYSSDGTCIFVTVETHEPLSFLQKLAEPFEYSDLLDKAAESFDCAEQLKYIAAFSYAFTLKMCQRLTRPFDALLGETYELDRTFDKGFKFIAEQISIAPKLAALHCIGSGWECQSNFEYSVHMQAKFISIHPNIRTTIILNDSDSEFSFPLNLTYKLHNILFGEAFFDIFGTTEIIEKRNQDRFACRIEYLSKFSEKPSDSPEIIGTISKNNQILMNIRGNWNKGMEILHRNSPAANWETVLEIHPLPKEREDIYYFTEFVAQLNEIEDCVAPTDSRLRNDIRDLENGKLKSGNVHKRHNIIGKLIPEVQGTTTIVGLRRAKGYVCSLHYTPKRELMDTNLPDVEGTIAYKSQPLALIDGTWRDGIQASLIKPIKTPKMKNSFMATGFKLVYKKPPIPSGRELSYNMSSFACSLNEKVNGVAPTDSRFREDVIALDSGLIDKSNTITRSLEEKQFKRMSNNLKRPPSEQYKPTWFVKNEAGEWIFNGDYWQCKRTQDWSQCPEIFK